MSETIVLAGFMLLVYVVITDLRRLGERIDRLIASTDRLTNQIEWARKTLLTHVRES